MYILGISAYYHDSAAALIKDGQIIAAAQEERFTRKKHDMHFPIHAINYCLSEAQINLSDIEYCTFYDKPFVKFERLLETYLTYAPKGIRSFVMAMPVWLKEKLLLKSTIKEELKKLSPNKTIPKLLFAQHHQSHAASAFFPSPFKEAAVLCLDGVGEWATTTVWHGKENQLELKWEIDFPHSIGLLYSAITYYTGFKVNSGEYKVMGLAPYGTPKYVDTIKNHLIDIKEDGTFRLNMKYFNFATGLTMTNKKFDKLFGGPPRRPESDVTQKEMDLAKSVQVVIEEIVLKLAKTIQNELNVQNLCLAGGVALNCVANGKIYQEKIFKNIWIQPAAGDAGGAIGCALSTWYEYLDNPRNISSNEDSMYGSYLGPRYSHDQIKQSLTNLDAKYHEYESDDQMIDFISDKLKNGSVVGWFTGRMEFGPRALGARSIIGDPTNQQMQSTMNLKIKYRESFRPFAPSVLRECVSEYFEYDHDSPYMLMVAPVKGSQRLPRDSKEENLFGIEKLKIPRSKIPSVTHVDYSARIQTVTEKHNPKYYKLIKKFGEKSGTPILVNTSFNVRGEPIVCSPEDAFQCFMRTEMDFLVLENIVLDKKQQQIQNKDKSWMNEFELD